MKKLICLILGILIVAGCLSGLAESAETSFVQIRENASAKVYEKPGTAEITDTLEGGRICGLLEETNETGNAWFFVFYLDSAKKGRTGYISAEDAVRLSQDELTALLADPEKFNEILDLIDAVNDYLKTSEPDDSSPDNSSSQTGEKGLQQFYKEAMEKLQKAFGEMDSIDLSGAADAAKAIGKKAKDAGEDLLGLAKDTAESLKDDLEGKADDAKKKLQDIDLAAKLEEVKKKVEEINPEASLKELKEKLENSDLNEKIKDLKKKIDESGVDQALTDLKTKTEDVLQDQAATLMVKLVDSGMMDNILGLQTAVSDLKSAGAEVGEKFGTVMGDLILLISGD